jgi:hypothetical protein
VLDNGDLLRHHQRMQWIVDIAFSNNVHHFHHFNESRDVAAAFVGSFIAGKALAGVRATLDTDEDGRIIVIVNEPALPLP